ncbi:hypothetical protein ACZ11_21510 [Lysinibacillus xylanilyticus]|uniref:Uncharacterized protein n=1 Tax=Lysinibacillus xylanilyticus TaxID=582475 RepID=A0A0K9F658_9BACI|nr:hypothetical protein ACZ11_21510 [Lysinibacillus xylanilyticus]
MINGEFHQTITSISKCLGSESKASVTNVLCSESKVSATNVLVAKAERQLRRFPTSIGSEMNANLITFQWVSKHSLKKRNSVVAAGWNYAEVKLIFF